ncbi:MAG: TIGR03663 family protein [Planctomycetes bacterium]|nr:TIGR03663 family protein [Planctomycetota bacterium]
MVNTRLFTVLIILTALGALASRLPKLGYRPMHCDEAVHAVKCNDLWQTGRYHYDLHEYHGPTLYYCTLPVIWLSGAEDFGETTEATYRIVPVVFGVGLIVLLLLIADGLGRWAAVCAGVLTAVSPAMSFYGRYYIQEILLVFFTFAAIVAGWRYVRSRHAGWAVLTGAAIGLMHATKETCIIPLGALLAALAINTVWHWRPRGLRVALRGYWRGKVFAGAALVALALSALLYSGFFTSASGPLDSLRTFATYFERAGGHGLHDHPWPYYLKMLIFTQCVPGPWWSEAFIIALAIIGGIAAVVGKGVRDGYVPLLRLVMLYTLLLMAIYMAIPYKTPWCMLGFLHGMILLAGVGVVALVRWLRIMPLRVAAAVLLVAGAGHLGWQAYRANTRFCADYRNPYVYSHPLFQVVDLARRIEDVANVHPDGREMLVKVMAEDCWPLPWYLRRLSRVGYWEEVPEDPDAAVIICGAELQEELEPRLRNEYQVNAYGLRAPAFVLWAYIERDLWNRYVDERLR